MFCSVRVCMCVCLRVSLCVRERLSCISSLSFAKKKKKTFEMRLNVCAVQQSRAGSKLMRALVDAGVKQGHYAVHIVSFFMFFGFRTTTTRRE